MSFYDSRVVAGQTLRRQKIAFTTRLRQNTALKAVSLLASLLLYVFVRAEHNPQSAKILKIPVTIINAPADAEVEVIPAMIDVSANGPRSVVDRLTSVDVRLPVDVSKLDASIREGQSKAQIAALAPTLVVPGEDAKRVLLEAQFPTVKVRIYTQESRMIRITARYPQNAPLGFHYGTPAITPNRVNLTGRHDRLAQVANVVVNASLQDQQSGKIDGDFPITAFDSDDHAIDNLLMDVSSVHVEIPLLPNPPARMVTVSPDITELPLAPFRLIRCTVSPGHVKIMGPTKLLDDVFTLSTQEISLRDLMETRTLDVPLRIPDKLEARDETGKKIASVRVRVEIGSIPEPRLPSKQTVKPAKLPHSTDDPNVMPDGTPRPQ